MTEFTLSDAAEHPSRVAIDEDGNVIAVGVVDGDPFHGSDGLAVRISRDGSLSHTYTLDYGEQVPRTGDVRADSADVFTVVAVSQDYYDSDDFVLAGALSGHIDEDGYSQEVWVQLYDSLGRPLWNEPFEWVHGASSRWNRARGVAFASNGDLVMLASAWIDDSHQYEWCLRRFSGPDVQHDLELAIDYGQSQSEDYPDVPTGLAIDWDDNVVIVGQVGIEAENTDWHVRKLNASGDLVWQHTIDGDQGLNDRAWDIALVGTSRIAVAGVTNSGTDNSTNADYDWRIVNYEPDGNDGIAIVHWDETFQSDTGRSEEAFGVALESDRNVLVAGYQLGDYGTRTGRLALMSKSDGSLLAEWLWEEEDDITLWDVDAHGDLIAVSGYAGSGNERHLVAALLELDHDADGVGNSTDLCAVTPEGEAVNADGCSSSQLDDDGDGVPNSLDLCPDTRLADHADENGCSWRQSDDDGDGVTNVLDQCPYTTAGETVDEDGCSWMEIDDDNDGVPNYYDLCPDTTYWDNELRDGCSESQLDDDHDGVTNDRDECPDTPEGREVFWDGCEDSPCGDLAPSCGCGACICNVAHDGDDWNPMWMLSALLAALVWGRFRRQRR